MSQGDPEPAKPNLADDLGSRHRKTLEAVFERPTRPDIQFEAILNLLRALGGEISQGRGSRVRVYLNGLPAVFHAPHPARVANKGTVESVRAYLEGAGATP
jgi:hypothetical protein